MNEKDSNTPTLGVQSEQDEKTADRPPSKGGFGNYLVAPTTISYLAILTTASVSSSTLIGSLGH